jgi:hypothetical protein
VVLILLLVLCWSFTHHYQGLGGDARLYAFQAMARIHPTLVNDLYLRGISQDSYTVFSDFYAKCIELFGLRKAAFILTLVFKLWFFIAAWLLARRLSSACGAFLAVALLVVTGGAYGAFGVFHYAEDWLTARSLAEALVLTAVACWSAGRRFSALLIACVAIFVHPLMALPGLLLLIYLELPIRLSAGLAACGFLLTFGVAEFAWWKPWADERFAVMDDAWLEVVRERSQFLFLQLWRPDDWLSNVRPFLSLSISALAIVDTQARRIAVAAMLIGGGGLAVALVASCIGPVSILLQGQAWRWVWVTEFLSILLVVPTIQALWRCQPVGLICAALVICGWLLSTVAGAACLGCAVALWPMRDRINAAGAIRASSASAATRMAIVAQAVKRMLAYCTQADRYTTVLSLSIGTLAAAAAFQLHRALEETGTDRSESTTADFSDWRRVIPPGANVWVVPAHNSAAFAWFTLERPSYLTVDQSSGVVFSRATALEVRRRAQVLLPVMDPDWRLSSGMRSADGGKAAAAAPAQLNRDRLVRVCADPQLNFVVAAENVGFEPLRHADPGNRRDLYLYDCRRVNSRNPSA